MNESKPGWGCFLIAFWMSVGIVAAAVLLVFGERNVRLLGMVVPGSWLALPAAMAVGALMIGIGPKIFQMDGGEDERVTRHYNCRCVWPHAYYRTRTELGDRQVNWQWSRLMDKSVQVWPEEKR